MSTRMDTNMNAMAIRVLVVLAAIGWPSLASAAPPSPSPEPPAARAAASEDAPHGPSTAASDGASAPVLVAVAPDPASVPEGSTPSAAASDEAAAGRARAREQPPGGRRRITFEEDFLVEGRLEKPSAYFILRRSHADYDWARLEVKFLPLVLESVQDPLF